VYTTLFFAAALPLLTQVEKHVDALPPSRAKAMMQDGLALMGTRYLWGADDFEAERGFDCAGLVYHLYPRAGLELPQARWSTLNMTPRERGDTVKKVWWTAYTEDFAKTMKPCMGPGFQDGDLLVYHALDAQGRIADRTGHIVIALNGRKGHALSAARSGVKLHALGSMYRYGERTLTGCWRAASAFDEPYARPDVAWSVETTAPGRGTLAEPYVMANPIELAVTARGAAVETLKLEVTGRVLAFIDAVHPQVTEAPYTAGERKIRLTHDFKAADLPVDPGEKIPTPLRKIVLRLFDDAGRVAGSKTLYVRLKPYW